MDSSHTESQPIQARLGLWDAVSIIVGIVIGTTIYKMPPLIFGNVSSPEWGVGIWVFGGALAFIGALCYAELGTTYPRTGGDYVYLSRAYGPWMGYLFGWAQLVAIITGSIGAMAYVFADYSIQLIGVSDDNKTTAEVGLAALAVTVLSAMNLLGIGLGKGTQNVLSAAKVLGLGGIIVAGFVYGNPSNFSEYKPVDPKSVSFGFAMIFVLYAYGGWNDAAFVAAEVRNQRRNLPLALLLGTGLITLIYALINAAYLMALGFDGAKGSRAIAADTLALPLGEAGSKAMCILVMLSALGAINGLILTGSRVYATVGTDYSLLAFLGNWNSQLGAPIWSLLAQGFVALGWIVLVGTKAGRDGIDTALGQVRLPPIPWDKYFGGFDTLVASTAPVFWGFFLLTGLSLFVLRERDPGARRPFSVPLYPWVPLIFCGTSVYMLYSALDYAGRLSFIPAVLILAGVPFYLLSAAKPVVTDPVPQDPTAVAQ